MSKTYYFRLPHGVISTLSPTRYEQDGIKVTKAEYDLDHANDSRDRMLQIIKPGTKIYTMLRHVSTSGMQRRISCFVVSEGNLLCIDYHIEALTGYKRHASKEGLVANGCGMDMGFAIVYAFGSALWPDGTPEPHGTRNGESDSVGGYALKQEWI